MMPVGFRPDLVQAGTSVSQVGAADDARAGRPAASAPIVVCGVDHRLAVGERRRLRHLRRLGDAHGEVAVGDGDRRDLHVLADDDGAGALVDDDAGRRVGLDREVADLGHEARRADAAPGASRTIERRSRSLRDAPAVALHAYRR